MPNVDVTVMPTSRITTPIPIPATEWRYRRFAGGVGDSAATLLAHTRLDLAFRGLSTGCADP